MMSGERTSQKDGTASAESEISSHIEQRTYKSNRLVKKAWQRIATRLYALFPFS